jgi:hypothetical protein
MAEFAKAIGREAARGAKWLVGRPLQRVLPGSQGIGFPGIGYITPRQYLEGAFEVGQSIGGGLRDIGGGFGEWLLLPCPARRPSARGGGSVPQRKHWAGWSFHPFAEWKPSSRQMRRRAHRR